MTNKNTLNILEKLPTFWKKSEGSNNYKVCNAIGIELFNVSNEKLKLVLDIQVNTAEGTRLDDLGRLFRLTRNSEETDESFRARIKAHWLGWIGASTEDAIKNVIARTIGGEVADVTITQETLKIYVTVAIDLTDTELQNTVTGLVEKFKAAGIYSKVNFIHNFNIADIIQAGVHSAGDEYLAG